MPNTQHSQHQSSPYSFLNPSVIINKLHEKNRQKQKNEQIVKRQLQTEVRKTAYKIKIKKFNRNVNLENLVERNLEKKQLDKLYFVENKKQIGKEGKFKDFDQFLMTKRVKNAYLKSKMKLFGNAINDRAKASIQKQINKQITLIDEQQPLKKSQVWQKNCQSNPQKLKKLKKVTVCHMVLDKLLALMTQNPKLITLKYQNQQLYKSLKEEMLNVLINDQKIVQSVTKVQKQMGTLSQRDQFRGSWSKFLTLRQGRKPFYLLKEEKKDELELQINKTLQTLQQIIQNSYQQFKKQHKLLHPNPTSNSQLSQQQCPTLKNYLRQRRSNRKSMTCIMKSRLKPMKNLTPANPVNPVNPVNEADISFQGSKNKQNVTAKGSYFGNSFDVLERS